jgi:hypothetical protein
MAEVRSTWGHIDDEGTVYVRGADGDERAIGSWMAGAPEAGLAYYERKYEDLAAEVTLLEKRVGADPSRVGQSARRLRAALPEAAAVGDLAALAARLEAVLSAVSAKQAEASVIRAAERSKATEAKQALVAEADALAASDDWRGADDKLRQLVERWKEMPRLDRPTDDALWQRLSGARSGFQRRRRTHFAELDERRKGAQATKEALVAEAEALSTSTDWAPATTRYKHMMTEWKAAGGAPKNVEESLWNRFRAAQDAFFARRTESRLERDAGLKQVLEARDALLAQAEALDPRRDLNGARRTLRDLQQRWEAAGTVPRDVGSAQERRLAAVETKIREAADTRWRPDPSDSPLVIRLVESIDKLERRAERARTAGRESDAAEAEASLVTQREWLRQARASL